MIQMKKTINRLGACAFILACAAWITLNGCTSAEYEGPAALNISELGPPRIDTLITNRWYFEECHMEVRKSHVPVLSGLPQATQLNARIRDVFNKEIEDSYAHWQEFGEAPYTDPSCGGCYSDTVDYKEFGFEVLDMTDSTLCLQLECMWYPHGGTAWSLDVHILNIDVASGKEIFIPFAERDVDISAVDRYISDFFGDNGIGQFYECHSCKDPGYVDRLIRDHHVGFIDGEWVGFQVIWPTTHGHAQEQMVHLPFSQFLKKAGDV